MATGIDIKALELPTLTELLLERGQTRYRAQQVFRWIHHHGVRDTAAMTNVPAALRDDPELALGGLTLDGVLRSGDGTRKLLLRTASGQRLESVVIPMGRGKFTQCISSQVGCKMACDFCATAEMPVRRNLGPSEIVDQYYHARALLAGTGEQVSNLVYMGMGEPLDNFDNVVTSLRILLDQQGAAIGQRRITVSTVGLAPRIPKFGAAVPVNLAVSLNATTDAVRDRIMPVNKAFPIARLMDALRAYPITPRRRIFVEYVMLRDVNDSDADATRLTQLLDGIGVKVNLIPFNAYPGSRYQPPPLERVHRFRDRLLKVRIQANVREPKGRDIQAACGMLDGEGQSG